MRFLYEESISTLLNLLKKHTRVEVYIKHKILRISEVNSQECKDGRKEANDVIDTIIDECGPALDGDPDLVECDIEVDEQENNLDKDPDLIKYEYLSDDDEELQTARNALRQAKQRRKKIRGTTVEQVVGASSNLPSYEVSADEGQDDDEIGSDDE
ncbi:conserved hypothetical protein [Ricinus communis]|uniref:Uncharacterized protein n=1 Tax=Ricinus communis TaxID=3988 RepID=B9STM0_RICCO|nr:conserved hypothetical protein [Ricinus communis]